MKKSLIKYILRNVKENAKFENRMIQVFNHELSGEDALDVLAFGYPTKATVLDMDALAAYISKTNSVEVLGIGSYELRKDCRLEVTFDCLKTRWFKTVEDADAAVAKNDRYSGLNYRTSEYTISRKFQTSDSTRIDLCDIEEIVEVERD